MVVTAGWQCCRFLHSDFSQQVSKEFVLVLRPLSSFASFASGGNDVLLAARPRQAEHPLVVPGLWCGCLLRGAFVLILVVWSSCLPAAQEIQKI